MTKEETKARFQSWCQREIGNNCSDEDYAMFNNIMALLEQSSDDCVSRQSVLETLKDNKYSDTFCDEHGIDKSINLNMSVIAVCELPLVTPTRKIGKWIYNNGSYKCPFCSHEVIGIEQDLKFCVLCGAEMKGVEDGEN